MAKYPFLTRRSGSKNLYYRRVVPDDLRASGRPQQIWKSLGTPDQTAAKATYARVNLETEALFESWRREDTSQPPSSSDGRPISQCAPLSASLLRRLTDEYYLTVYDRDFAWRGDLWKQVRHNEEAFWQGDIIRHPKNDAHEFNGASHSYYWRLMECPELEDVFLYCVHMERKDRLATARRSYELGDAEGCASVMNSVLQRRGISLSQEDQDRLKRGMLKAEILALEDAVNGFEARISLTNSAPPKPGIDAEREPAQMASELIKLYVAEAERINEWPLKTINRKIAELHEFVAIAGDKPVTTYTSSDGNLFKDVQLKLPAHRHGKGFKGLSPLEQAAQVQKLITAGETPPMLSPLTINDKIGTVSLFFDWLRPQGCAPPENPLCGLSISRPGRRKREKAGSPWTIDELNRMFEAPIYTGCKSLARWSDPGDLVPTDAAIYWIPLIGLFSGMRLGEIVQLRTADFKSQDGISYFDITTLTDPSDGDDSEPAKSLKNVYSRRSVPVHKVLMQLGLCELVDRRRQVGTSRLFPDFRRAEDDESWSKTFSKHFTRFRRSIGCTRARLTFHSLRHNVEDALRNADVRKEVRDAVQGHGETGVSREYGTGYYLTTLNDAVQKIDYLGLRLPERLSSKAK